MNVLRVGRGGLGLALLALLAGMVAAAEAPEKRPPASDDAKPAEVGAAPAPASGEMPDAAPEIEATHPALVGDAADRTHPFIRFQFDGIPYTEVVRRFAQMAGKPLVGDLNIQGTLTFFDAEPYTYGEALDTLNLVLAMRGYQLVETKRFLQLEKLENIQRMPIQIFSGAVPDDTVRPGEIITVVLPLKFVDPETAVKTIQPMISSFGKIAALGKGKGIIVTDRHETIQRARRLLATIDTGTLGEEQLRTFVLKHAAAKEVAEILTKVLGASANTGTTPENRRRYRMVYSREHNRHIPVPVEDSKSEGGRVVVTTDDRTNMIILVASPDKIALAEEMIERLDVEGPAVAGDLRIFKLENARAEDVARVVGEIMPGSSTRTTRDRRGRVSRTSTEGTRVVADPVTNRVIVSAPFEQMARVADIIRDLDQASTETEAVKIFRLAEADAAQLGQVIQASLSKTDPRTRRPTAKVTVNADPRTNTLIVAGAASDIHSAEKLIAELDRAPGDESREVHVVQLKAGDARQLAQSLQRLYTQQGGGRGQPAPTNLRVEADAGTNSLIISAAPGDWPIVQKILEELQTSAAPQSIPSTARIAVKHAPVRDLAQSLTQVFGRRPSSRTGPSPVPVVIAPDEHSRSLLVSAADDDMQTIVGLVQAMDVPADEESLVARIIRLKSADATALAETLRAMLPPVPRGRPERVVIQAEPASNSVLLRAPEGERTLLEEMIARLDEAVQSEARETRMLPLKGASARALAATLAPLYGAPAPATASRGRGRGGRPTPPPKPEESVILVPSPDDRILIVEGSRSEVEEIAQLVASLDTEAEAGPIEFRTYSLAGGSNAVELSRSLAKLFAAEMSAAGGGPTPSFEADGASNTLFVAANGEQFKIIEEMLSELPASALVESLTKTYTLKNAQASRVAEVLGQMLAGVPPSASARSRGRGRGGRPIVGADVRVAGVDETRTVVVQGPAEKIALAEELIQSLDVSSAESVEPIRMIRLASADATALAATLTAMVPQPGRGEPSTITIQADPASNSVLLRAPEAERTMLEQMIASLDEAVKEDARELRSLKLKSASAAALADMVAPLFDAQTRPLASRRGRGRPAVVPAVDQSVTLAASPNDRVLVVEGPRRKVEEVAQLVATLDIGEAPGEIQFRTYALMGSSAVDLARSLARLFAEETKGRARPAAGTGPKFEADGGTNQLLVAATEADFAVIDTLIEKLAVETQLASQTRTFTLQHADARQVADVLQLMLAGVEPSPRGRSRGRSSPPPATAVEVRVTGVVEIRSVVVQGPGDKIALAEELIASLDVPVTEAVMPMKMIRLESADAAALAETLRAMLPQTPRGQTPAVFIEADPAANAVLLRAPGAERQLLEEMIASLDQATRDEAREMRILELKRASAEALSLMLAPLHGGTAAPPSRSTSRGRRSQPTVQRTSEGVVLTPSPDDRKLVVEGPRGRVEKIAQLVASLDAGAEQQASQFRTYSLANSSAVDLARSLARLFAEETRGGPPSAVPAPKFEADGGSNQLLVSATEDQFTTIDALIETLQATTELATQTRTFRVRHAQASSVANVLGLMLAGTPVETRSSRGRGKPSAPSASDGQVRVTGVDETQTVVVQGTPEKIALAEDLIASLDVAGAETDNPIRMVRLESAEAAALAESLKAMLPPVARGEAPTIFIEADKASNSVLLRAPETERKRLEEMIASLDQATRDEARETRVVTIERASAAALAETLAQLQSGASGPVRRDRRGRPIPSPTGQGEENVTVAPAPDDRSLVLDGPPARVDEIAALIARLDTGEGPTRKLVRTYQLATTDAAGLAQGLTRLFAETTPRGKTPAATALAQPRFEADPQTNQLMVAATADQFETIETVIRGLQVSKDEIITQIVPLAKAQAETLAAAVNASLAQSGAPTPNRGRGRGPAPAASETRVTVTPEPNSNSVLVRGPARDVPVVVEMIKRLDAGGTNAVAEVRVFPIENGDAGEVSEAIETLFKDMIKQQTAGRRDVQPPPFSVTADLRTNNLIVSTTPAYFDLVQNLVMTLDAAPERAARDVHYVWLENADATDLAAKLSTMYADRKGVDKPVIEPDLFSNALTIIAKTEDLLTMEPIIQKLDDAAKDTSFQVRVVPLAGMKAARMARVLQNVYQQMTDSEVVVTENVPAPESTGEGVGRRLVPGAADVPESEVAPAEERESKGGALFLETPLEAPPARITIGVEPESNALIVSGPRQELDHIETLLDELMATVTSEEAEYRIFDIKKADPTAVATTLDQLFNPKPVQVRKKDPKAPPPPLPPPVITVVADARTHSLIVRAKPLDFEVIEALIRELDRASGAVNEVRIFGLKNTDAVEVADNLNELFNPKTPVAPRQKVQQKGSKNQKAPTPQNRSAVAAAEAVEFAGDDGVTTVGADTRVSITANQATNSIVVAAPSDVMELVARIIEELDQSAALAVVPAVRMYPLANADVKATVEALREVFVQASRGGRPSTQKATEAPVVITGDEGGRQIIVSAAAEKHELIARVIADLDAAQEGDRLAVRVYRIRHADAAELAGALSKTLADAAPTRGRGPSAGEVRINADRSSGSIVVRAPESEHERIAALVAEMDVLPAEAYAVRLVPLKNADPEQVAAVLSRLYGEGGAATGRGRGRGAPSVTSKSGVVIEADKAARVLMVRADDETFDAIRSLALELDAGSVGGDVEQALIGLRFAQASSVAAGLSQAFAPARGRPMAPEDVVTVVAEPVSNSLIVTANAANLARVRSLIEKLDTETTGGVRTEFLILEHARAPDLANVLARVAGAVGGRGTRGAPGVQTVVSADAASNALVMSGPAGDVDRLLTMARDLDTASAGEAPGVWILPLERGEAGAMAAMVRDLYAQQARAAGREKRKAEPLAVSADESANALVLACTKGMYEQVAEWVGRIETMKVERGEYQIIALANADPTEVEQAIRALHGDAAPSRGRGRGAPAGSSLQIAVLPQQRALVVSATSADFAAIKKLAEELDAAALGAKREIRVYGVAHAEIASTVALLQEILGGAVSRGRGRGRPAPVGEEAPAITGDETARKIIVAGTPDQHELTARVIREIDDAHGLEQVAVKVYRVEHAEAGSLAQALSQALTEGGRKSESLRISADRSSNALVVRAQAAEHERIAALVAEMDVRPADEYPVRTIALKNARAEDLAPMLTRIFTGQAVPRSGGRGRSMPTPTGSVIIEADPAARMLLVRADEETFARIEALATGLDARSLGGERAQTLVKLEFAQAASVAQSIERAFAPPRGKQVEPEETVAVVAEPFSNSLIVTANGENFAKVEQLVAKLDTEEAGGSRTEFLVLQNARATDLANTLSRVASAGSKGKGAAAVQPVVVSADASSNALVMNGPEKEVEKILAMAHDLDQASAKSATDVFIMPLTNGDAAEVAAMVRDLYSQQAQAAAREKRKVEPLAVSADTRANALVLATTEAMHGQVTEWVGKVESMTPSRGSLRVITLQFANPADVERAIQELYGDGATSSSSGRSSRPASSRTQPRPRGRRGAPGAAGAAGPSGRVETTLLPEQRSILIKAADADFEEIMKLVQVLEAAASKAERDVRVFTIENATNTRVAQALAQLYRDIQRPDAPEDEVVITALTNTRAVVVAATPEKMEEVEHLISQLDTARVAPQLEFRVYVLEHAQPVKILPALQQMLQQVRAARPGEPINAQADERTRSIIVTARGTVFDEVEKIIKALDEAPAFAEAEVLIIRLKKADATRLAGVLQDILRPSAEAQVTPEARALQEQVRRLKIRSARGKDKFVELDLTKPIKITADPVARNDQGANALIISSTPDNLKAMEAVVALMDTVPLAEGVRVRLIHLRNADAESVMSVLEEIFTKGVELGGKPGTSVEGKAEPESVSGKALTSVLNVSADVRTNTLVLAGIEETLVLAELIINDLDREVGKVVTEVRLFQLRHADPDRLALLLQSVFSEATAQPGTEGLRTQVTRLRTVVKNGGHVTSLPKARAALTIQADPSTNIVIVAARSDVMPLIADVIQTMDIPGAGSMNAVRIIPLTHADATRLKGVLDGLYTGPNAAFIRDEDRPTIVVDTRTNALVVSGSDRTFAMLDTLLKQLDAETPVDQHAIRVLMLENADAVTLAQTLQTMMDARVQRQEGLGAKDAEALRVAIAADERSNSLIVTGSPESFELVKTLAERLDAADAALGGQVRIIPLEHGNAGTLGQTLTSLFTQRYQAARTPDLARQKPVILPDLRTNALIVASTADDAKILTALLARLDVELVDPAVQLVVLPLEHNDAGIVGPMIKQIFDARLVSMTPPGATPAPQDRVDVAAEALSNALVISASRENLALIRGLLEKVDVEPPAETGLVRMYGLERADAQRVATMLDGLLAEGLYKPGLAAAGGSPALQAREKVSIAVDTRTNVLIVSASKENFAVIEEVLRRVDGEDAFGALGDVRVYPLDHANATRLAPTLQQFFDAKLAAEQATGGSGRALRVSILPDARTNALLVAGSRESFAAVEALVERLDAEEVTAASEFRVFYLKEATAAALQPMLERLFARRPTRETAEQPVTIVADPRANALVIGASPEDMKLAETIIARLDVPHAGDATAEVFALAKADVTQVANTLRSLFQAEGAEGIGISVDERTNALVVSAGTADMKRVADLVRQLDTDAVTRVTEIRIFTLENAQAEELAQILTDALTQKLQSPVPEPNRQTLLQFVARTADGRDLIAKALQEGVLITADRRTNSLIVSAPVENMPLLESLIASLDSTSPRLAEIKLFRLANADASQMAEILRELLRMEAAGGDGERAVNYRLVAGGADGPAATTGTAAQYALTITVDPRTNSLLVGGTRHYVDLVGGIIEELDSSPGQERMTQVYRLRNAQAVDIEAALRNFLDQERQRLVSVLGEEGVGAAQRLLEREVAVVAETNTNSLLLSASPRYFQTVADMIRELDQPPPQVLIQVLLAEVRLDDTTDLGVDWNLTGLFRDNKVYNAQSQFGAEAALGTTGFTVAVTGGTFGFFLRALESQGRVEILSRPQILAADNQTAHINVGQRVPFVTNSRVTDAGSVFNTISYEDVGIMLDVVPHINPDGFVRLEVKPEISSIAESTVEISENLNAIVVNTRTAETTVTVQDGHTIVIGGLITSQDTDRVNKIPLLGDLPWLGNLFKSTHKVKERTELLIILTPTVLRNVQEADEMSGGELERLNLFRGFRRDEDCEGLLPWELMEPRKPLPEEPRIDDARLRTKELIPPSEKREAEDRLREGLREELKEEPAVDVEAEVERRGL